MNVNGFYLCLWNLYRTPNTQGISTSKKYGAYLLLLVYNRLRSSKIMNWKPVHIWDKTAVKSLHVL